DELSGYVNIEVTYEDSAESALDIADGIAVINMVDRNGNNIANLLNEDDMNLDKIEGRIKVEPSNEEGKLSDSYVSHISIDGHDEAIQFGSGRAAGWPGVLGGASVRDRRALRGGGAEGRRMEEFAHSADAGRTKGAA